MPSGSRGCTLWQLLAERMLTESVFSTSLLHINLLLSLLQNTAQKLEESVGFWRRTSGHGEDEGSEGPTIDMYDTLSVFQLLSPFVLEEKGINWLLCI